MVIHSDGRLDHKYSLKPDVLRTSCITKTIIKRQIENYGNSKQFKISWVRHGVSCGNITEVY